MKINSEIKNTHKSKRITLNGSLGSGKSVVGKLVAEHFGIPFVSSGEIFREIGRESNLNALDTNIVAENNSEIDFLVDKKVRDIDKTFDGFVLDSRMAWSFASNSINVYLDVDLDTATKRIFSDQTRKTEKYASVEIAQAALIARRASENKRYKKLYNVDIEDRANYDLYIVTDSAEVDEVANVIIMYCLEKTKKVNWLSKKRLVPMIDIRDARDIVLPAKKNPENSFSVPLYVEHNFGFYYGDPIRLVDALQYEHKMVPFSENTETNNFAPKSGFVENGIEILTHSDLYDWEEITDVSFDFHALIGESK